MVTGQEGRSLKMWETYVQNKQTNFTYATKTEKKINLSMTMINFLLFTLQERKHDVWRPIVIGTEHM